MLSIKKTAIFFSIFILISVAIFYIFKLQILSDGMVNVADDFGNSGELGCKDCNLVIISLTNTRKDHVGIYGYERDTTPNIDKFFENSLIFENAFAPASWTLPVATSLYTSLFPYNHGVMDRYDGSRLPDEVVTFTEILKQSGYQTAGFTGGGDYSRSFNFNQGFDVYVDEGGSGGPKYYLGIKEVLPQAMNWLDNINYKNKFFLLIQGFDTHCPFVPKEPFDKKFIGEYKSDLDFSSCLWTFEQSAPVYEHGIKYWPVKTMMTEKGISDVKMTEQDVEYMKALYDGEIAQIDNELESFFQLINNRGLEKNTIFIFMSEHGDLFGEHGRFMRGGPLRGTFYDPVLNFPLLIKHPKIKEPIKIDSLVQTVDLMPTLLDIFGILDDQEDRRQGKSIISDLVGEGKTNDFVYAASKYVAKNNSFFNGISVVEAIRNDKWKFIEEEIFDHNNIIKEKNYELYDISNDPKEENNLYNDEMMIATEFEDKLNKWKENIDKK